MGRSGLCAAPLRHTCLMPAQHPAPRRQRDSVPSVLRRCQQGQPRAPRPRRRSGQLQQALARLARPAPGSLHTVLRGPRHVAGAGLLADLLDLLVAGDSSEGHTRVSGRVGVALGALREASDFLLSWTPRLVAELARCDPSQGPCAFAWKNRAVNYKGRVLRSVARDLAARWPGHHGPAP